MISFLVAMDDHRVIGKDNQLPWHLPADLAHFKQTTSGHPIIMGRKTFASIGRALPNRQNIVITRDRAFQHDGIIVVHSLAEALAAAHPTGEIFIIGGAQIYAEALPMADKIYLTLVKINIAGDTFFPAFNDAEWDLVAREANAADEKNPYDYDFLTYAKRT